MTYADSLWNRWGALTWPDSRPAEAVFERHRVTESLASVVSWAMDASLNTPQIKEKVKVVSAAITNARTTCAS